MALGIVDLQSRLGAQLLQCRERPEQRLRFAVQRDNIGVGCTKGVRVVSGQVFECGQQHQREHQGPMRSPSVTLLHSSALEVINGSPPQSRARYILRAGIRQIG